MSRSNARGVNNCRGVNNSKPTFPYIVVRFKSERKGKHPPKPIVFCFAPNSGVYKCSHHIYGNLELEGEYELVRVLRKELEFEPVFRIKAIRYKGGGRGVDYSFNLESSRRRLYGREVFPHDCYRIFRPVEEVPEERRKTTLTTEQIHPCLLEATSKLKELFTKGPILEFQRNTSRTEK